GLLPKPMRVSRRRLYGTDVIGRVRLVQFAREAGFTIGGTRTFVGGVSANTPPAVRLRTLAGRELTGIDEQVERVRHMKILLESSFHCRCLRIEDCARILGELAPPENSGGNP